MSSLQNRCTLLGLPVYASKNFNQTPVMVIPITEKASVSFQNICCNHTPVVELPALCYITSPEPLVPGSKEFNVITREYSKVSLDSHMSVGTPKLTTENDVEMHWINAYTLILCKVSPFKAISVKVRQTRS